MIKKLLITSLFAYTVSFAQTATNPTVLYDFNNLTVGNLNGQDSWVTTKFTSTTDAVVDTGSSDKTKCLYFRKAGANVGLSASKKIDTIFGGKVFTDLTAKYVITYQYKRNYWGFTFGIGADLNSDGKIDKTNGNEQAFKYVSGSQAGADKFTNCMNKLYSFIGATNNNWGEVKFELYDLNIDSGRIDVSYRSLASGTWNKVVSAAKLGLDTNSAGKSNPKLWNMLYMHFETDGAAIDNISLTKITSTIPTSIAEKNDISQISLYPNPVRNVLHLLTNQVISQNASVQLLDIDGKLVKTISSSELQCKQIDISNIDNGIYFLRIQDNVGTTTHKIIKE